MIVNVLFSKSTVLKWQKRIIWFSLTVTCQYFDSEYHYSSTPLLNHHHCHCWLSLILFYFSDMMIFFWVLLPLLAVNGQYKSWKQINIKVSKYDCWFEIEKVKVATMWKIQSREMKPLQVIVTVIILSCNKIVHNCIIAGLVILIFFIEQLGWRAWL